MTVRVPKINIFYGDKALFWLGSENVEFLLDYIRNASSVECLKKASYLFRLYKQ